MGAVECPKASISIPNHKKDGCLAVAEEVSAWLFILVSRLYSILDIKYNCDATNTKPYYEVQLVLESLSYWCMEGVKAMRKVP